MSADDTRDRGVWTPSNVITITRILLVPVFVAVLLAPWPEWFGMDDAFSNDWKRVVAACVFILISCTDWLDGYLARSRNEITDFGKFMDPLADKILVAAALISLVELGELPTWVVLIILAREFIVSGVRMMAASKGTVIAASMLGKFKTVFQMIAIVLFTVKDSHMVGSLGDAVSDALWDVSWLVMISALVLTIASMVDYLVKGKDLLGFGGPGAESGNVDYAHVENNLVDEGMLADTARSTVSAAIEKGCSLSTAESLTGGLIGSLITSVPGSSEVYKGGIVSYVNEVKRDLLGVDESALDRDGAVCEQVALDMAKGSRKLLEADIAVSVTGIAGPGGAEPGKPIGTVWMGVSTSTEDHAEELHFEGSREDVRRQTALNALLALEKAISEQENI